MSIEEKLFGKKRFVAARLPAFGFQKTGDGFRYETDLMNGDLTASVYVSDSGTVRGKVEDKMNGEEYRPMFIEGFHGAYVDAARAAYEELLARIAEECCDDVPFTSDQANRIAGLIKERYGVAPDYPWAKDETVPSGVFRHTDTAKWFALIMNVRKKVLFKDGDGRTLDVMNLKAAPEAIGALTDRRGILPAYHMNRKYWITVLLDDSLSDADVMALADESFRLTDKKNGAGPPEKA